MRNHRIHSTQISAPTQPLPQTTQNRLRYLRVGLILLLVVLSLILGRLYAAPPEQSPYALVQQTTGQVLQRLQDNEEAIRSNPVHAEVLFRDIVAPHFDFQRMSRLVLGKYWRRASAEQRARFPQQFQVLLIRTYTTALAAYADQEIRLLPERQVQGDETLVRTEVVQNGGPVIPVDYRMYRANGQWKVYDVIIDGISLVTTYRNSFASQIRHAGIDGLLEKLVQKNQQVANAR
jgi:phospholipid transport system substrate-binding protein